MQTKVNLVKVKKKNQNANLKSTLLNVSKCKFQHFVTFVVRKENLMLF